MPSHTHDVYYKNLGAAGNNASVFGNASNNGGTIPTTSSGSDYYHNNIQPYLVVYMYKRTA